MFGPVDCPSRKLATPRILRSFGVSQESASHMSTSQSVTGHLPSSSVSLASAAASRPHTAQSHLREPKLPCFGHPERLGSLSLCLPNSAPTLSVHPEAAVHGPVLTPFVIGLVSFWFSLSNHEGLILDQGWWGGTPTCQPAFSLLGSSLQPLPLAPKAHCSFLESGHKTAPFQKLFLMFLFLKDQIQFLFPSFAMLDLSCGMRTQGSNPRSLH